MAPIRDPIVATVKGQPINQTQINAAQSLLLVGQKLGAPPRALQACIFAAIFESDLGLDLGPNSGGYGGLLGGATSVFGDVHSSLNAMATSFFQGGNGFQAGGAIAASGKYQNVAVIGSQVTAAIPFDSQGISTQYESQGFPIDSAVAEAVAIVNANGGGTAGGGTFGLGGTGTPANQPVASLWTVGDPSHPDQDYWTTINQYSMGTQWYTFSDAETLFVADGIKLMAQQPQGIISRLDPHVIHAELTYDNTAFQYTHTHRRKGRIQRRTALQRLTSPTEVIVQIICDIDQFRSGDTVVLAADFGPAAGIWLVGQRIREIYLPYTELTLVQAMQPINAATGTTTGPPALTGPSASKPGAGTVIAAMLSEAATINNSDYPYVWAGGHAKIGTPDIGSPGHGFDGNTIGFDCSGAVAAVLGAGGLLTWGGGNPGASNTIVDSLLSQNKVVPGPGTGTPECTLYDTTSHIFMKLNGEFFGTEDGAGHLPATQNQGAGWIPNGQPGSGYRQTHVQASILGQQAV